MRRIVMLKRTINFLKNNYILLLNLIVLFILFYITLKYQQYFCLNDEEYFMYGNMMSFSDIINNQGGGRLLAANGLFFYKYLAFLSGVPQDFASGIGAFIKTVFFSFIALSFSFGFFINLNSNISLKNKEGLFIIPISFLLLSMPLMNVNDYNIYLGGIRDTIIYFDYFLPIFLYFSFWLFFINIILKNNDCSNLNKIFILVISFCLGFWNELSNCSTFISLSILMLYLITKKEKVLIKKSLLFIVPFIIGFVSFYMFSDYPKGNSIAGYTYNIENVYNIFKTNINAFLHEYWVCLILNKIIFYVIFIFTTILLLSKKDKFINSIVFVCFSMVAGYLILNFNFIFLSNLDIINKYNVEFMFQRDLYDGIYTNILEFVSLILIGCVYSKFSNIRQYISIFLIIFLLYVSFIYSKHFSLIQNIKLHTKLLAYKIEKINLVYNYLGETTILPVSYLNECDFLKDNQIFPFDSRFNYKNITDYTDFLKNKYFDSLYVGYSVYFNNQYKRNFIGVIFVDDSIAFESLSKRLALLGEKYESDNEIIKNKISFKSFNKYQNKKLTLDELNYNSINDDDLIIKIKAYINYKENNIDEAVKLYNKVLEKNKNDFDALINIGEIYLKQEKIKEAENIYKKLHKLDNNNLTFLNKLLDINYYYKKDYNTCLEICNLMIDIQKNMYLLYFNKAIVLYMLGKDEEADLIVHSYDLKINFENTDKLKLNIANVGFSSETN